MQKANIYHSHISQSRLWELQSIQMDEETQVSCVTTDSLFEMIRCSIGDVIRENLLNAAKWHFERWLKIV